MNTATRLKTIECLRRDWGTYIERYSAMPPAAQAAFLTQQGYPSLGGLLGHVIAWWEAGRQTADAALADPNFKRPQYDIDAFNAQAVERAAGISEAEMVARFEALRLELIDWVQGLPDHAFDNPYVLSRLHNEIDGHLEEHKLPR